MKKLLSSILAVILLLSVLTVPVFAANSLPFTDEDYLREDFGIEDYREYKSEAKMSNGTYVWDSNALVAGSRRSTHFPSEVTTINFPTSTEIIGISAINGLKGVTSINFSELTNLKFIDAASVGYTKISEVDLTNTQVVRIGMGAFGSSENLVTFKSSPTLKRIDNNAFEGCLRLTNLELNEGLEYIGDNALGWGHANSGYNNVIIPSTVNHIGTNGLRTDKTYKVYKGSYGEQWCKDNNVKYTYVDGSPVSPDTGDTSTTSPTNPPTNNTTAPTMEHTQKVGGVTFSNFVSQREVTSKDANGKDISVYVVEIGPNGCMRSDVDNTQFLYYCSIWNSEYPYLTNEPHYSTSGYTTKLETYKITAYPSTKNSNGTWSKGLTWQYGDFDTYYGDYNKYSVVVTQGSNTYYYYVKVIQNPVYPQEKLPDIQQQQPTQSATANPNNSKVLVNGKTVAFDSYNINNNNYFKLRDIAQVLRGTDKQFEVVWDSTKNAINMTSNKPYTTVGGELKVGDGVAKQCTLNSSPIYKDGVQVSLTAYTINGNNYFKLRDLGQAFNFDVSWDAGQNAVVIDTKNAYNANT